MDENSKTVTNKVREKEEETTVICFIFNHF